MQNSNKNWIGLAIALSVFNLLPLIFFMFFGYGESLILSSLTSGIITAFAIWISFYFGNKSKIKSQNSGDSKGRNIFSTRTLTVILFLVVYILLSYPFIDNRTATGEVAMINFESITFTVFAILNTIAVAIFAFII